MAAGVIDLTAIPHSRDGFYATNNQFQVSGKKGFTEFKLLENEDLYFRVDLPGVPSNGVRYFTDSVKKGVIFTGEAPKENKHDMGDRKYLGATCLICNCCELTGVWATMRDGVLRVVLQKKKINKGEKETNPNQQRVRCVCQLQVGCESNSSDNSSGAGRILEKNPFLLEGSQGALESKPLKNGGLYVRIDLPGVAKEDVRVFVQDGEVRFYGGAKRVMVHDVSSRDYIGSVGLLSDSKKIGRKMKSVVKNGVLRMTIPPS